MKKRYLTLAGIAAAAILAAMFIGICLSASPFPFLPPSTTIDPVTEASVDNNNMLILSGSSTLPESANISITILAPPGTRPPEHPAVEKNDVILTQAAAGRSRWTAPLDLTGIPAGTYTVSLATYTVNGDYSWNESAPVATASFTLGDADDSGNGVIHQKTPVVAPYIRINTQDEGTVDGSAGIDGITSLDPGTPLAWGLYPVTGGTLNGTPAFAGTATVTAGTNGVNRWAFLPANGTPAPGRYGVLVTAGTPGNASGTVSVRGDYEIPSGPGTPRNATAAPCISIDALPDVRLNGVYLITGTTSLPAGGGLLVQVTPASFESGYNFSLDAGESSANRTLSGAAVFAGAVGGVEVVNGSGGRNLWSFRFETYRFSPGVYIINVSNDEFIATAPGSAGGTLYSSRVFGIGGKAS